MSDIAMHPEMPAPNEVLSPVMNRAHELSDEGSTSKGVVIGVGVTCLALAAAYGLMQYGYLPSVGIGGKVKAEPAVVTRNFSLTKECYDGYDTRTASTAKISARISSGKLLGFVGATFDEPIPGAWISDRVSGIVETTVCQDSVSVPATFTRAHGAEPNSLAVTIPYSALSYDAKILPETRATYADQGFAMVGAKNFENILKVFTDRGIARQSDEMDSILAAIAEEKSYDTAVRACGPVIQPEIDANFKANNIAKFVRDAAVFGESLDPSNISVTFTGDKPTYLNPSHRLLDIVKADKHFSIQSDSTADCSLSDGLREQRESAAISAAQSGAQK